MFPFGTQVLQEECLDWKDRITVIGRLRLGFCGRQRLLPVEYSRRQCEVADGYSQCLCCSILSPERWLVLPLRERA